MIVAQRLRKGACGSPRGAARLVVDALKTVKAIRRGSRPLLRADSAFHGQPTVSAAVKGSADVSVTVRLDPRVRTATASIRDDRWKTIPYTDAIFDEDAQRWISRAEGAEISFHRVHVQEESRPNKTHAEASHSDGGRPGPKFVPWVHLQDRSKQSRFYIISTHMVVGWQGHHRAGTPCTASSSACSWRWPTGSASQGSRCSSQATSTARNLPKWASTT